MHHIPSFEFFLALLGRNHRNLPILANLDEAEKEEKRKTEETDHQSFKVHYVHVQKCVVLTIFIYTFTA